METLARKTITSIFQKPVGISPAVFSFSLTWLKTIPLFVFAALFAVAESAACLDVLNVTTTKL
ncbi:MAG: hypothetical protein KF855_03170 [Acidobacteria bacterium]|nr:hypothetical protein [Acidobacteriota bacterium]